VIAAAPQLKAVCNFAVGYNNIDLAACTRAGIMATNTPGVLDDTTADLAWALLMATARHIQTSEHWLRAGHWQGFKHDRLAGQRRAPRDAGHPRHGAHRPGRGAARAGLRHEGDLPQPQPPAGRQGGRLPRHLGGQGDLLREADFLVLLLPYSAESHHIIGAAELALMKPTAHLINVARGGIVDDAALISALRQRRLSGAALDVFEGEPKLNPGFLELDNVTLTPHIGSSSRATRMAMAMTAANNLIAALSGQRPPNLVNIEVWR
jgi:gluconate 2-dehydrogenase